MCTGPDEHDLVVDGCSLGPTQHPTQRPTEQPTSPPTSAPALEALEALDEPSQPSGSASGASGIGADDPDGIATGVWILLILVGFGCGTGLAVVALRWRKKEEHARNQVQRLSSHDNPMYTGAGGASLNMGYGGGRATDADPAYAYIDGDLAAPDMDAAPSPSDASSGYMDVSPFQTSTGYVDVAPDASPGPDTAGPGVVGGYMSVGPASPTEFETSISYL